MAENETLAQEPRPERAVLMLTADEKRAVRFMAAVRDVTESDLLRDNLIADILSEWQRIRPAVENVA